MFSWSPSAITSSVLAADLNQSLPAFIPGLPLGFQSVPAAIATIFNIVIVIAGTIFVVLFLIGGIMYLTGAGNEEQTGKAKKLMVDAIIGLVLTLAAWAIALFILDQLGFRRNGFFLSNPTSPPVLSVPPASPNGGSGGGVGSGFPSPGPSNPTINQPIDIQLTVKVIDATSRAIVGAEVLVDNVPQGTTGTYGRTFAIQTGSHALTIKHVNYTTITTQANITEEYRTKNLVCVLQPATAGSCYTG